MSFWSSTAFERNRYGKGKGAASAAHAEDSQPNESIDKRRRAPSLVVPSKQNLRSDSHRGFRGRGMGWRRGGPLAAGHTAYKQFPPNIPRPVYTPPGPTNSVSGRVPAEVSDASTRQPITHDSTEAVIVRPNPFYERRVRISDSGSELAPAIQASASRMSLTNVLDSNAENAPSAPKAQAQPTLHNFVSPVQTIALPVTSRVSLSPPPPKRRRVESIVRVKVEEFPSVLPPRTSPSPTALLPPHTSPSPTAPPVRIKQEKHTPSPPPADPPRRSATSGSKRYWPVPDNCKRALNPQFDTNRRDWLRRECTILKDHGLKVVKYFFRDDGMVIEWQTRNPDKPVWLDTLRPVQERPRLSVPVGQEIIDLDPEPSDPSDVVPTLPPPPPITGARERPLFSGPAGHEIIDLDADPLDASDVPSSPRPPPPSQIAGPPNSPPTVDDTIPASTEDAQSTPVLEEDLQQLSLDFVQQYIRTFDRNRDALAAAYSEDAIISFRDNSFASPTHFTFQRKGASVSQSKPGTMPKLPTLQNYRFSPHSGTFEMHYDTVVLEPELGLGPDPPMPTKVMLSVHGQLVGTIDERAHMAIDQTFLLRRNISVGGGEAWPLLAISHQIVVRDTPWVRWTGQPTAC
ncbi:hypothetical protein B0H12DRAFT_1134019 [Mycena haematopus]|nr:hypothetical protein B0H12DRAFT_1134019 [Mycena haematopus]